jgi:hypothetical protein
MAWVVFDVLIGVHLRPSPTRQRSATSVSENSVTRADATRLARSR